MTDILMIVVAAVLAITLHEAAHGYAAWALGDDTAKRMGRLSLNPLRHVDRVGTVLLPGFLLISQLLTIGHVIFMFGWAKPVPVAAWRFPNPRRGMMLVAAAGPGMNFLLAWLAALTLHALPFLSPAGGDLLARFVGYFVGYNLILGLFNLLPIPPLDGGRIVVGVLPEAAALQWAKLERAGIAIVLLVVFLLPPMLRDLFHVQFDPVRDGLEAILPRAIGLVEWLAGLGSSDV
ncbi:MAG TPA: site-2 protease family protein [Acetobacteraceae bacterium]